MEIRPRRYDPIPADASPNTPSIMPIIKALEHLYGKFNKKFFDNKLSKIVVTLSKEGRRNAYGWLTTKMVWQDNEDRYYEINLCPEYLNRPIEEICGTLLHEMVHLKNALDEIQDCSRSSQYHNKKFKLCAERHGLNVVKTAKYGWADTSLKPETLEFIETLKLKDFELFRNLNFPKADIEDGDEGEADSEEAPKTSSSRKYVCPVCKLSIRATKEVRVRCDKCDELLAKNV